MQCAVQRQSELLREGRLEDGPPYKLPGNVWSTIARHNGFESAKEGLRRVLDPSFGPRVDPKRYRIAAITPAGRATRVLLKGEDLVL